jgi:hypothetical protein
MATDFQVNYNSIVRQTWKLMEVNKKGKNAKF